MFNTKVLLLILATTILAYGTHLFFKKMINPRRSVASFLLYIILHLVSVLLCVFIFGLVINKYKEFFFK